MSFRSFGGPSSIHLFVSLFAAPVTPVLDWKDCRKRMVSLTFYLPTVIFISLVGGFLPLLRELSQKALALLLSFSAGVLLGAVFFHMFNPLCNRRWHKATAFASEKATPESVLACWEV